MSEGKREMGDFDVPWRTSVYHLGSVTIVGLVVLFLELFGAPSRRGYFCDDDSIKYPIKPNTISESVIVLIAVLIPLIIVALTEFWTYKASTGQARLWRFSMPQWVYKAAIVFGGYMLGLGLSQIMSGVGKFTIGRLRPHFLAVCQSNVTCDGPTPPNTYILAYTCAGDPDNVSEARLSFPSGHASVAFFASVYLMIYLHYSVKWSAYGYCRGLVQFLLALGAWWTALTRVMDHWHHWSDVLAGALLGTTAAYLTAKYWPGLEHAPKEGSPEFLPLRRTRSSTQVSSTT